MGPAALASFYRHDWGHAYALLVSSSSYNQPRRDDYGYAYSLFDDLTPSCESIITISSTSTITINTSKSTCLSHLNAPSLSSLSPAGLQALRDVSSRGQPQSAGCECCEQQAKGDFLSCEARATFLQPLKPSPTPGRSTLCLKS